MTNQQQLNDLLKDDNGFFFEDVTDGKYRNMAHLSLRNAIKLYVKTADELTKIVGYENAGQNQNKTDADTIFLTNYATTVCDVIIHLQHFIELYLKDILLSVSPLLVYNVKDKYDIIYKMIKAEHVLDSDLEKLHFIEGSEAIKKVKTLINESEFFNYSFLKSYFDLFEKINTLRNRIAHRGAFVLRYKTLDELMGKYVLPFIKNLESHDCNYYNILNWNFNLHLKNVDPFQELIDEYKKEDVNCNKVYVLKMISYAAYNNEIPFIEDAKEEKDDDETFQMNISATLKSFYKDKIEKAEQYAHKEMMDYSDVSNVVVCPICGCKSLQVYEESDGETDFTGENYTSYWKYICGVLCKQCGFHLDEPCFIDKNRNGLDYIHYYKHEEWAENDIK